MAQSPLPLDEQELGNPRGTYTSRGIVSKAGRLIAGVAFALGGLALLVLAIRSIVQALGDHEGLVLVCLFPGLYGFLAVMTFGFAAWLLRGLYNSLGLRVRLYAQGFAIDRRGHTDLFRWDEIDEFRIAPYTLGSARTGQVNYLSYHVRRKDGHKAVLDEADLPGTRTIGDVLCAKVSARMLPAMIAAFERGEAIQFGELKSGFSVSQAGIQHKGNLLTWEEVDSIQLNIDRNSLQIVRRAAPGKKARAWAKFFLSAIPNSTAFIKLVDHVRS
jgi:hypothetical protein